MTTRHIRIEHHTGYSLIREITTDLIIGVAAWEDTSGMFIAAVMVNLEAVRVDGETMTEVCENAERAAAEQ